MAGLDKRTVNIILNFAKRQKSPARRQLLTAGQPATHLFMLKTGRIRYYKTTKSCDEIALYMLANGDVFGLGTLLKQSANYMGSAEAMSDCELLVWEHASIRTQAVAHPQLAENALRIVLQYLRSYVDRHIGIVNTNAQHRLAVTLLDLGHRTGRVLPTGVEIEATNEQLGSLADISCFTASRLLKEWERGGAISKVREKVVIHTPEALATEQTGNSMLGSVFLAGVAFTFSAVQQRQAGSVYLNLIRQAFPKCVQQDSRLLGNQEALLEKTDSCFG